MNQRWMGSVRKTTKEAKKKGKRRLHGQQQQLFERPTRIVPVKPSSQRLLNGSMDLLALTFDSEPTLNKGSEQGEEEEARRMEEEEEAESEEDLRDNRYNYHKANNTPNSEQHHGSHTTSSTSKLSLKRMDEEHDPLEQLPHTEPLLLKQSLNESIFKIPSTLPSLIPPAIPTRREIRKPTPPSPAVVSKAMQQMDSMVPIPLPPPSTTSSSSASTIPKYTLDSVISANEYEDVAINNKEN